MSHTVGVVGHTARRDMINRLAKQVRPDVLSIDDGTLGCGANHRAVWQQLAQEYPHARWTVVLEDDALPVPDFDVQLEAALKVAPTPIVSLYLGKLRPRNYQSAIAARVAADTQAHWFIAGQLLHAVGVAVRTSMVHNMLAHIAQPRISTRPIDEAITLWCVASNLPVSYTWPSLVDHADEPTVITEREARTPGRVAWRVGGRSVWCSSAVKL